MTVDPLGLKGQEGTGIYIALVAGESGRDSGGKAQRVLMPQPSASSETPLG